MLTDHGLTWSDVLPALELVTSVEQLANALEHPSDFLEQLAASMGPAAKKLALAMLKPKVEPLANKMGLEWRDVLPALELVDSVEELHAAVAEPEAFLLRLGEAMGPAAKRLLIAKAKPHIEPIVITKKLRTPSAAPRGTASTARLMAARLPWPPGSSPRKSNDSGACRMSNRLPHGHVQSNRASGPSTTVGCASSGSNCASRAATSSSGSRVHISMCPARGLGRGVETAGFFPNASVNNVDASLDRSSGLHTRCNWLIP